MTHNPVFACASIRCRTLARLICSNIPMSDTVLHRRPKTTLHAACLLCGRISNQRPKKPLKGPVALNGIMLSCPHKYTPRKRPLQYFILHPVCGLDVLPVFSPMEVE